MESLRKPSGKPILVAQREDKRETAGPERLAGFIRKNTKPIVSEWETFARTLVPASNAMTPLALRDHIHEILAFIVSDIESPQTGPEQIQKSHGGKERGPATTAAETHAALRLAGGFDIDQMVSEWRALRASVIKLWGAAHSQMGPEDVIDMVRFNESIDQGIAESVSHYTQKVGHSKDLFIGILSHDLRSPLNVVSTASHLLLNMGALSDRQTMLVTQISESTARIIAIVNDLLDVTRARFGSGLSIIRAPMDMGFVTRQLVDELRMGHPNRTITLEISGDLKGEWDKARIGQMLSNLIGNAIQYSFKDSSVGVTVRGASDEVVLSVHNEGVPIPPEKIVTIFDSLTRAVTTDEGNPGQINLGLGLYIAKDVVLSHHGTMEVTSSEEDGTTFTARFPRSV